MNTADDNNGEITLGELLRVTWAMRARLFAIFAACILVPCLIVALLIVIMPEQRVLRLPFSVNFASAINNEYPNGLPFQAADVVSPTVMQKVYRLNGLSDVMSFEDFKASFSVREYNEKMESLRLEYGSKLSNDKLTQAERSSLELEYAEKMKGARAGEFELVYFNLNMSGLTEESVSALLQRILEVWANEARTEKGAYLYDIGVLGEQFYDKTLVREEEYVTSLDMLRQSVGRLLTNLQEMQEIPGINLVKAGEFENVGLKEIRISLEDLRRFEIDPLIGRIRVKSEHKDVQETLGYLEDQLFNLNLDVESKRKMAKSLEDVLYTLTSSTGERRVANDDTASPTTAIAVPQFGEGFLSKIMELSVKSRDVEYRREILNELVGYKKDLVILEREQAFYQSMLEAMDEGRGENKTANPDSGLNDSQTQQRFKSILDKLDRAVRMLNAVYLKASQQSLQPEAAYTVTGPLNISSGLPLGLNKLMLIISSGFVFFLIILFAILITKLSGRTAK